MKVPEIGLGTWDLRGEACTRIVQDALQIGYRCIDTAHNYENHVAIGKAIKNFSRNDLFLVSKLDIEQQIDKNAPAHSVEMACERALKELGTDYLDLYLIHWPDRSYSLESIFSSMEGLVQKGKIKKAGVSNFTIHHLEDLRKEGFVPSANQVEFHPYLYQKELLQYCQKHHIELISYRPFGKSKLLQEESLFSQIGEEYSKSAAQVILRWLIQKGIPVVPKASSEKHLRENLNIYDFSLTKQQMEQLDQLNQNKRYCGPEEPEFEY